MAQIPHGPAHLKCPLWKRPMDQVCHACPLWIQIRGTDPNTGETVADEWQCSLTWLPKLLIDVARMEHQTGAAVEDFRNRMMDQNQVLSVVYGQPQLRGPDDKQRPERPQLPRD